MDKSEAPLILQAPKEAEGERIDSWLARTLQGKLNRSQLQKAIAQETILLNGEACRNKTLLREGDEITFLAGSEQTSKILVQAKARPLDILFEDSSLIVVNKPAGISVHPSKSENSPGNSLVEALLAHCQNENLWAQEIKTSERPGVVHRLDKETTGALVWAKNQEALENLQEQFRKKSNKREYLALLDGTLETPSLIRESTLIRDPKNKTRFCSLNELEISETEPKGKWAKTFFSTEEVFFHRYTLARVQLETGRTHQIRVHAKDLGAPVLGDQVYKKSSTLPKVLPEFLKKEMKALKRQMLHAEVLGFKHPLSKEPMAFSAKLPEDFQRLLALFP